MKKLLKKGMGVLLSLTMLASLIPFNAFSVMGADGVKITEKAGWVECGYVKWEAYSGASDYKVYYKTKDEATYRVADDELVRNNRVDLLDVAGNKEVEVKVVPVIGGAEDESKAGVTYFTPYVAEKTGWAFSDGFTTTGGYNADRTVPENATVLYISQDNVNTITIQHPDQKGNLKEWVGFDRVMRSKEVDEGTELNTVPNDIPMIIRVIGTVTTVPSITSKLYQVKSVRNITFEGVGDDATFSSMGLEFTRECKNVEVRNLNFVNYGDDGLAVVRNSEHCWVHNNYFGSGYDGACDAKRGSTLNTYSYNICEGADKAMLCGHSNSYANEDKGRLKMTYHHNYFKGTKQRNPRVRFGQVHVLNNYYDGVTLYGVGSACEAHVLVENNYFHNTARPYVVSKQGDAFTNPSDSDSNVMSNSPAGYLKAVGNYIDEGCTHYSSPLNENLTGFDFDPSLSYSYTAQSPQDAKDTVLKFAGTIKQAVPNGGGTDTPVETTTQTTTQITTVEIPTETTTNNVVLKGDVNSDGTLTASDGANVLAFVLNSDSFSIDKDVADADSNGQVTASDAATILAKVLNNDFIF